MDTGKTEVMDSCGNGTKVNIKDKEGRELNQVDQFKYLGVTFSEEGGSRVKAAWQKMERTGASDSRLKDTNKVKDQAIYHSGETCHLVWSRTLDDRSERGKYS